MMTTRSRRGHAYLEFSLVLPVLLVFIYGIMEYGWMFFQRTAVQEAARQGCRRGATISPHDDFASAVEAATLDAFDRLGVDCDASQCVVTAESVGEVPRMSLQCEASVEHRAILNVVPTPERLGAGFQYYFEQQ